MKKTKNDHKLAISKIRKELDNYNHRLRSGTDENRQKQRSLQLERNIKQTADMTAELEHQLADLENIPDDELEEWSAEKAKYESELERFNATKEELISAKNAIARELASLENDLNSTIQRRERLQGRRSRLSEQHERIVSANAQGLNERERRAAEQFAREQDHARQEARYNEQFASYSQSIHEYQLRSSQLWQQASAIEQALRQQQMFMETGPITPEGNLPGTNSLPESTGMPLSSSLTTTAPNHRSLLGMSFPSLKSSPLQSASSPVRTATTSHPASPAQQPSSLQQNSSSPRVNSTTNFNNNPDSNRRGRSFSNRSTRSGPFGPDFTDMNRLPPLQVDLSELITVKRRSSASDGNGPNNSSGFRPISSPLRSTGSDESGSGSGNGSGSGSPRGKGNMNVN